jgi:tRNA(Met) cytidine acetyltransferase
MHNLAFSKWFHCFQQQAFSLNERRLVVLVGDYCWSSSLLKSIDSHCCNDVKQSEGTWLVYGKSENIKATVNKQRFQDKLGTESNYVVFHGVPLSIDALAGLSGTLVSGGVLFLLIDDMSEVDGSLFYQRFFKLLNNFSEHVVIEEHKHTLPVLPSFDKLDTAKKSQEVLTYRCVTQEQVKAVEAVMKVFNGKRNRPLVITADRGRGKSTALAIACAELLMSATKEYILRLVITAPNITSLSVFFQQLASHVPNGEFNNGLFSTRYGTVEFIAIDQLIKSPVDASLVLIDEAAAIPIYLLEELLQHHSRLVFASTVHGYEGAGRGFTIKFQKTLIQKYPKWQSLHLHEPIRWGINDPLEKLIFETCLLNAELPAVKEIKQPLALSQLLFRRVNTSELTENEVLFKQVFAVLVTAHYQTKPSDVMMLLDNEQLQLVCLFSNTNQYVVAVALLINEGSSKHSKVNSDDVLAISQAKRRLKNHFVPQSLLTQCGIEDAFNYHYLRVMRIAVHPELQEQGLGTHFLDKIVEFASLQKADFLASSFGATRSLLSFWLKSDFHMARLGFNKDKASGEQSALVLKALSPKVKTVQTDIVTEFYRSFDYLLVDEYKYVTTDLVALILKFSQPFCHKALTARDQANVKAFAAGYRQYSSCAFSLHLWMKETLSSPLVLADKSLLVCISRIMQKQTIKEVCTRYGFTGKKDLEQSMKATVNRYLSS